MYFSIHERLQIKNYAQCFHQAIFRFSKMFSTCIYSCGFSHGLVSHDLEGTHEFGLLSLLCLVIWVLVFGFPFDLIRPLVSRFKIITFMFITPQNVCIFTQFYLWLPFDWSFLDINTVQIKTLFLNCSVFQMPTLGALITSKYIRK